MKYSTLCALFGLTAAAPIYDPNHTDVVVFSQLNFDKQVTSKRDKGISIVQFYKQGGKFYIH